MVHLLAVNSIFLLTFFIKLLMADDCPPDKCAKNPPTVDENGKIVVTVFYDNDQVGNPDQRDTNMVLMMCDAMNVFGDVLVLDFKMGASTEYDYNTNILYCYWDCLQDLLEACAAKFVLNFPQFACCNNTGRDVYQCAADQGVTRDQIDDCMDKGEGIDIVLGNSQMRIDAELPACYLPDVLYNGRNDRCKKFTDSTELIKILCKMYIKGGVILDACDDYDDYEDD